MISESQMGHLIDQRYRLAMQTSSAFRCDSMLYDLLIGILISCNWLGGHASVLAMDWFGNETLHDTPFANITIHGEPVAAVQNVGNFSFA